MQKAWRAAVSTLLDILLAIVVAIFAASQFRYQGYAVADLICESSYGMCDKPLWLGSAAVVLFVASVGMRKIR
jgi:hypothetical protein